MIDLEHCIQPRWKFFLARLFGKKIVRHDGEVQVTLYRWRRTFYVADISLIPGEDYDYS